MTQELGELYKHYEVLGELHRGGMGAIFKVRHRHLDQLRVIKVIRAELRSNEQMHERFAREAKLATQIQHRNIARFFDFTIDEQGTAFMVLEYIPGCNLKQFAKDAGGQLAPDLVREVSTQGLEALAHFHSRHLVHRDISPDNLMVTKGYDGDLRVKLIDFGIAKHLESETHLTETGLFMGKVLYASPEQFGGAENVDERGDLYSFAIMMYELLTGAVPFSGSQVDVLSGHLQKPPPPFSETDPEGRVPEGLRAAVLKALEKHPGDRYQTAREMIDALDELDLEATEESQTAIDGILEAEVETPTSAEISATELPTQGLSSATGVPSATAPPGTLPGTQPAGALDVTQPSESTVVLKRSTISRGVWILALVLILGTGGWIVWRSTSGSDAEMTPEAAAATDPVSVLVADFDNQTGEAVFDGALEQALGLALEGAPFISAYQRPVARQKAAELDGASDGVLDAERAQLVCVREGIQVLLAGGIATDGDAYRIQLRVVEAASSQSLLETETRLEQKSEIFQAADRLAGEVRRVLGSEAANVAPVFAGETFSTSSLEAIAAYARAQELQAAGQYEEAVSLYEEALEHDERFGRAWAGMAASQANLGQRDEAEQSYRQAMAHLDRMTEREKYRTRGGYYLLVGDHAKAIEEYTQLVGEFPADSMGMSNLALAHFFDGDMDQALSSGRQAVELSPQNAMTRNNLALYAMYAGDFEIARQEAGKVLEQNPGFEKAHIAIALSELADGAPEEAREVWSGLAEVSDRGASLSAAGLADLALLQGRAADAREILIEAAESDRSAGRGYDAALKFVTLARVHRILGDKSATRAALDDAGAASQAWPVQVLAAREFLALGDEDAAHSVAVSLIQAIQPDRRAYGMLLMAEAELLAGNSATALAHLTNAQQIADTWLGRLLLGRAYLEAGAPVEAHSELEACVKRRGEATALFLEERPTYSVYPPTVYWLARAEEELGSAGAGRHYQEYLEMRSGPDPDPLADDARRRLGG